MTYILDWLGPQHWDQIPDEARPRLCEDTRGIVCYNDGVLVGAVILDTWTDNSCQIHIWLEDPMSIRNGYPEAVFNFVFEGDNPRELIIGATPEDNKKALRFIKHMGFEPVTLIPDAHQKGVGMVITQLRKENCKWLEIGKHEQKEHATA